MSFLSVLGNAFTIDNKPIRLRGIGLGNWLNLEHFMLGIPGCESEIREAIGMRYGPERAMQFWQLFYHTYVGEADIARFSSFGLNLLRVPFNYRRMQSNHGIEQSIAIQEIDRLIPWCKKHHCYLLLDLHAAKGCQNPDWHSDNPNATLDFWTTPSYQEEMIRLWEAIAAYYKDEPVIAGYDLINEPCYFSPAMDQTLVRFSSQCIDAIRRHDTAHTIFIEGNTYARDFSMFKENLDDNLAYTFHFYPFLALPGQLNASDIEQRIEKRLYRDVTLDHLFQLGRPILCGETGHPIADPGTASALRILLDIFERLNIGWALWPHKDARAMGLFLPQADSAWMRLAAQMSDNWAFFDMFNQDSILSVQDNPDKLAFYRTLAKETRQAHQLFVKKLDEVPFDTLCEAVRDFDVAHCEINPQLESIIQPVATP